MLVLLAIAAVVLAVIRSVSYLGMWGDTNANISTALPWLTAMIVPAVCVVVFAYAALARLADAALPIRFQPALLLILVGLRTPRERRSGSSPWSYRSTSCSRTSCSGPSW